jgi:hypothetical protein
MVMYTSREFMGSTAVRLHANRVQINYRISDRVIGSHGLSINAKCHQHRMTSHTHVSSMQMMIHVVIAR